jgi:hypothetical protein
LPIISSIELGLGHVGVGIGHRNAEIGSDRLLRRFDSLGFAKAVEDHDRAGRSKRTRDAKPNAAG